VAYFFGHPVGLELGLDLVPDWC